MKNRLNIKNNKYDLICKINISYKFCNKYIVHIFHPRRATIKSIYLI